MNGKKRVKEGGLGVRLRLCTVRVINGALNSDDYVNSKTMQW